MTQTIELVEWMLNGHVVRVPHDAMLYERRSADAPTGNAGAYFWGGIYRYDHELEVPTSWANKHIELEFEGVMGRTLVLVNDMPIASHAYGYTGFRVDLSKKLVPGSTARISV